MKLHIKNGRLIDPAQALDACCDVYLDAGRVAAIGQAPAGFQADRVMDAAGLAILPGLIDLAARLPVRPERLAHALRSALAGGITSLVALPQVGAAHDEPRQMQRWLEQAEQWRLARLYPLGGLTRGLRGEALAEMAGLAAAGCIAFSQGDAALVDTRVLLNAMQYAQTYGYALWLQPQDFWLARGGAVASGAYATRLGLAGVPEQAETLALQRIFELQRATGVRVHLSRISSAAGLALIRDAKRAGLPLSCDVSINQLHLCDVDIGFFNSNYHLQPPLRGQRDRAAIQAALLDGTVDAICSDHHELSAVDKARPFACSALGATGLPLLLSLVLMWAREQRLDLAQALSRVGSGPAAVLRHGAPGRVCAGQLTVGAAADLCLVDLAAEWRLDPQAITPFAGMMLPGRVQAVLVGGRLVWGAVG